MNNKMLKKSLVVGIISIIVLASFPIVLGNTMMISKENTNDKPADNGDIIFRVFGFKNFYVWVRNTRAEQITVYVNYTMKWNLGGTILGANSTIYPFPVNANSFTFIFWDCQPMPFYRTNITVEAGGQTFYKNGITIFGLNFFPRSIQ